MKPVLLIAWREYKQYILSRGFLLFLVMFPIGVAVVGGLLSFVESAKPAREYVIYDETGEFAESIEQELERVRKRTTIHAWDFYVSVAIKDEALEMELLPFPYAPGAVTQARIAAFHEAGPDAAAAAVEPYLAPNAPAYSPPRDEFLRRALPSGVIELGGFSNAIDTLRPYLLDEKRLPGAGGPLFAAILIPDGFSSDPDSPAAEFWSRNLTDTSLQASVAGALDTALQRKAVSSLGLAPDALDEITFIEAPITAYRADKAAEEAELSTKDRIETTLPAAMTYMLLVIIFGVGNLLLTNTIEERSNKIVEVLLSSVTADQLMLGKLIGIGAVGLTLPTIFAISAMLVAFGAGGSEWTSYAVAALFESNLIFVYLFYFLSAYVIFAMMFLAIGAVSNSLQDAQSYMGPVMILVFLPLPFMLMVYHNPNGVIASILTWIPIYTPYAVMMRAASSPPLWEIIGATAFMLAFAFSLTKAMGRIFRRAILQAQPPKVSDVWRYTRRNPH